VLEKPREATLTLNPLNAELNPICHFLALLGGATIVVVSRLRVKLGELGGQQSSAWCAAAGMDGHGLSAAGYLPCHAGRKHTALTRYTKKKLGEFLFPSTGRTLQFFPPLKCADFINCVREVRITLYVANTEMVPVK
jgi:hypothetical protein